MEEHQIRVSIARRRSAVNTGSRALAVLVAAGLVAAVLIQLWLDRNADVLVPAMAGLCACGVIAASALVLGGQEPLSGNAIARDDVPASPPWRRITRAGAVAGIVCAVIGALRVAGDPWAAQDWWLIAMILPALAMVSRNAALRRPSQWAMPRFVRPEAAIVIGIIGAALFMRVYDIAGSPPFVHGDEAHCGLSGRLIITGQAPVLSIGWYNLPMLSYAVSGLGLLLFGDNLTGLRLINAVLGTGGVLLVYLLGRELFGRRAAILAGFVLAVAFLNVDNSRDGVHYIQGPVGVTLTLYLVVYWLRHGGALAAYLAGVSMVVDLQLYWAARVGPVLAVALVVYLAAMRPHRHMILARWREAGWLVVGLVVSGLPLAALFAAFPGSLVGHDTGVSILSGSPDIVGHLRSVYGSTGVVSILLQQTWKILTTFNWRPDASLQIAWTGAMLDTVSGALLPAALVLALLRVRRWPYALPLAWFGAVAAAGILTIDPPWWPRLAALAPAIALLIGALLAEASRLFETRAAIDRRMVAAALAVPLLSMAAGNVRLVFVDYPATMRQAVTMESTLVGNYLARTPNADKTVLLSDRSIDINYDPVRFLAPRSGGCTLMPGDPLSKCPLTRHSRLYVLLPGRVTDLAWLEKQRPGGTTVTIGTYSNGASRILAYRLPDA